MPYLCIINNYKQHKEIMTTIQEQAQHEKRMHQMQKAKQCRKILRMIESRILDLQVLKGGFIMTNKAFRTVLKEHQELAQEFEILQKRKFKIERKLWKLA